MDQMSGGGMTPEQMQAYLEFVSGQGAFDEQDRAVQQQLAMADALRKRNQAAQQHTTGAGAIFGGIGDVINSVAGARGVKEAQNRDTMMQQARIDALRKMAAAQMQPQPQQPGAGFADPGVAALYARRRQPQPMMPPPDLGAGGD